MQAKGIDNDSGKFLKPGDAIVTKAYECLEVIKLIDRIGTRSFTPTSSNVQGPFWRHEVFHRKSHIDVIVLTPYLPILGTNILDKKERLDRSGDVVAKVYKSAIPDAHDGRPHGSHCRGCGAAVAAEAHDRDGAACGTRAHLLEHRGGGRCDEADRRADGGRDRVGAGDGAGRVPGDLCLVEGA